MNDIIQGDQHIFDKAWLGDGMFWNHSTSHHLLNIVKYYNDDLIVERSIKMKPKNGFKLNVQKMSFHDGLNI